MHTLSYKLRSLIMLIFLSVSYAIPINAMEAVIAALKVSGAALPVKSAQADLLDLGSFTCDLHMKAILKDKEALAIARKFVEWLLIHAYSPVGSAEQEAA